MFYVTWQAAWPSFCTTDLFQRHVTPIKSYTLIMQTDNRLTENQLHSYKLLLIWLSTTTTATILWPLSRTFCVSRQPQLTTGGFCWSKVSPFAFPRDKRTEKDSACFVDSKENKWVGSQQSWSKEGTVRQCQSKEANILWLYHEDTRKLPGERNNARNNARCTQVRKTMHGLDRQHQDVDRTPCARVSQNNRR